MDKELNFNAIRTVWIKVSCVYSLFHSFQFMQCCDNSLLHSNIHHSIHSFIHSYIHTVIHLCSNQIFHKFIDESLHSDQSYENNILTKYIDTSVQLVLFIELELWKKVCFTWQFCVVVVCTQAYKPSLWKLSQTSLPWMNRQLSPSLRDAIKSC